MRSPAVQPKVIQSGHVEALNVLGVEHLIHVQGSESNGAIVFAELRLPAGAAIPRHVHTREDEVFHVIQGHVAFTLGEREAVVSPGTTVFGPRGLPHGFRAVGGSPARMLLTFTPAGLEKMFADLSRLPAGAPDLAKVAEMVGRYGISFA